MVYLSGMKSVEGFYSEPILTEDVVKRVWGQHAGASYTDGRNVNRFVVHHCTTLEELTKAFDQFILKARGSRVSMERFKIHFHTEYEPEEKLLQTIEDALNVPLLDKYREIVVSDPYETGRDMLVLGVIGGRITDYAVDVSGTVDLEGELLQVGKGGPEN